MVSHQRGARIQGLRERRGETQAAFAESLGVDQSRVSQWERGLADPSTDAWLKLGALVAEEDPAEAEWFWSQTGLEREVLASLVTALMMGPRGGVGMETVLETAEARLKELEVDEQTLVDKGAIVLVPPFTQGEWRNETTTNADLLPLPSKLAPNKASTFYIAAARSSPGCRFAAGDRIVFDAAGASERKVLPFLGRVVLLNFTHPGKRPEEIGRWPAGLFMGRLGLIDGHNMRRWIVLGPVESIPHSGWNLFSQDVIGLYGFRTEDKLSPAERERRAADRPLHRITWPEHMRNIHGPTEADALPTLRIPEGCDIMGRVIAVFSGEAKR